MGVRGILLRMSSGCARREGEMESIRPTIKRNKSISIYFFLRQYET